MVNLYNSLQETVVDKVEYLAGAQKLGIYDANELKKEEFDVYIEKMKKA